jgi:hypothetical protein
LVIGRQSAPGDWVEITVGSILTLRAPPGTVFRAQRGKDSFTGSLKGPGFDLDLDYGALRGRSAPVPAIPAGSSTENVLIDNKPARITFRQVDRGPDLHGRYSVGLEVTQLETPGGKPLMLNLSGSADGLEQQVAVRKVFTTIRFRRR